MIDYIFQFALSLFNEIFLNELFEIIPLTFLFVIGLVLLNQLKHVA